MYCNNCGNQIPEGQNVCNVCGAVSGMGNQQNQYQQNQYQPNQYQQNQYQSNQYQQNLFNGNQYQVQSQQSALGMNWFKFIIYFQLFVSMLSLGYTGIMTMTGGFYKKSGSDMSDLVYQVFPSLKPLDIIFGIICIGLAVLALVARFALAAYKANGPKLYLLLLVCNIVVSVIYIIAGSAILGEAVVDSKLTTQIITSIVLVIANTVYFRNRKHLFVN